MRSKRTQQFDEDLKLFFTDLAQIVNVVGQRHEARDRRIKLHILNIGADLLDRPVECGLQLLRLRILGEQIRKSGHTLQETLASFYRVIAPRSRGAVISHKQHIGTQRICTVCFHDVQRIHDVSFGFTHLVAVRSKDQSLRGTLCVRLRCIHHPDVIEEVMPETRINHMSGYVLHTAVIPVHRHPVFQFLRICQRFVIVRINISQEIPG